MDHEEDINPTPEGTEETSSSDIGADELASTGADEAAAVGAAAGEGPPAGQRILPVTFG